MPLLSVGNLAMGGRGKTPVVALVARLLLDAGERPAILSRGYGRRHVEDGVVVVSDGRHLLADLDRSGDEPLMLARRLPGAAVLVCEQRAIAAALATRALGASVLLLDDGFQHRALARDADVVLVTPADLEDRRLPFGRLRESVRALARAHAVVVELGAGEVDLAALAARVRALTGARLFTLRRRLGAPCAADGPSDAGGFLPAPPGPVLALAGIAEPARFTRALGDAGWVVAATLAFRDHHRYGARDLARVAAAAREARAAAVVTTDKDAQRLLPLRPWPVPIFAVPLEVSIEPFPGDAPTASFADWVFAALHGART